MLSSRKWTACYVMCLSACATDGPIREVSTQTVEVAIPGAAVACLRVDQVPLVPALTVIDLNSATPGQKAKAVAADLELRNQYAKKAADLLQQCSKLSEAKP